MGHKKKPGRLKKKKKRAGEVRLARNDRSPNEFRAELSDARVARAGDNSHVAVDISTRIQELSVIKDIEEFATELESFLLRDRKALAQAHIKVVNARAMEEPPVGRPERSESAVLDKR